jgi:hypothetical protein
MSFMDIMHNVRTWILKAEQQVGYGWTSYFISFVNQYPTCYTTLMLHS